MQSFTPPSYPKAKSVNYLFITKHLPNLLLKMISEDLSLYPEFFFQCLNILTICKLWMIHNFILPRWKQLLYNVSYFWHIGHREQFIPFLFIPTFFHVFCHISMCFPSQSFLLLTELLPQIPMLITLHALQFLESLTFDHLFLPIQYLKLDTICWSEIPSLMWQYSKIGDFTTYLSPLCPLYLPTIYLSTP